MAPRQTLIAALVHGLLAGYALWAVRSGGHWLARTALAGFAGIFAVQGLVVLTRNERMMEATYSRGLAWLEPVCNAGLVAGTLAERRWPLSVAFLLAGVLMLTPAHEGRKAAGRLLFFGSWVPYRLGTFSPEGAER